MGRPVSDRQTSAAFSSRENARSWAHASPPTSPASSERLGKPSLEGLGIRQATGLQTQDAHIASPEPEANVVPDRVKSLNAPGNGALILPCPFAVGESNPNNGAGKEIPLLCQKRTFKSIAWLNEHIGRVHSLKYICRDCRSHEYPEVPSIHREYLQRIHESNCHAELSAGPDLKKPASPSESQSGYDHVRMSEEQHRRWLRWRDVKVPFVQGEQPVQLNWRRIYKSLYPNVQTYPSLQQSFDSKKSSATSSTGSSLDPTLNSDGVRSKSNGKTERFTMRQRDDLVKEFCHEMLMHMSMPLYSPSEFFSSNTDLLLGHLEQELYNFIDAAFADDPRVTTQPGSLVVGQLCREIAWNYDQLLRRNLGHDRALAERSLEIQSHRSERNRIIQDELRRAKILWPRVVKDEMISDLFFHDSPADRVLRCLEALLENDLEPRDRRQDLPRLQTHFRHHMDKAKDGGDVLSNQYKEVPKMGHPSERSEALRAFDTLTERSRLLVELYYCQRLDLVSERIMDSIESFWASMKGPSKVSARFHLDADILGFLQGNYTSGIRQTLRSVLCFVGQFSTAQLTSIGDYFDQTWPLWPHCLLDSITEYALDPGGRQHDWDGGCITIDENGRTFVIEGSDEFIVSMGQQLAWLAAACQTTHNGMAYSRVDVAPIESEGDDAQHSTLAFHIRVLIEAPSDVEETKCWGSLMGESVLVSGFPILSRSHSMIGLESKLEILAGLIGIQLAVTYRGGYVLKGRFHALAPVLSDGDMVQWHLVTTWPRRLQWVDISKQCPKRLLGGRPETLSILLKSRAMLGWCGEVENLLATSDFSYDLVRQTKSQLAPMASSRLSELTIGFSHILKATATVTFGSKDGVSLRQRSDLYETILDDAADLNIFLHDTQTNYSILTNGERLILHVILHAHYKKAFMVDGIPANLSPLSAGGNLRAVMMANALVPLIKGPLLNHTAAEGTLYFKDKVQELYERLEGMHADAPSSPFLGFLNEASRSVRGWEYLEFVKNSRTMNSKLVVFRETCGSWPSLATDPEVKGIFLVGEGFGDILRPVGGVCPLYQSVPKGLDYLALTVVDLLALPGDRETWDGQERLTSSGWAWHKPDLLFEPCNSQYVAKDVSHCSCKRVQVFLGPSGNRSPWFGRTRHVPPGSLEPKGAVIFGQPRAHISGSRRGHTGSAPKSRADGIAQHGLEPIDRPLLETSLQFFPESYVGHQALMTASNHLQVVTSSHEEPTHNHSQLNMPVPTVPTPTLAADLTQISQEMDFSGLNGTVRPSEPAEGHYGGGSQVTDGRIEASMSPVESEQSARQRREQSRRAGGDSQHNVGKQNRRSSKLSNFRRRMGF